MLGAQLTCLEANNGWSGKAGWVGIRRVSQQGRKGRGHGKTQKARTNHSDSFLGGLYSDPLTARQEKKYLLGGSRASGATIPAAWKGSQLLVFLTFVLLNISLVTVVPAPETVEPLDEASMARLPLHGSARALFYQLPWEI